MLKRINISLIILLLSLSALFIACVPASPESLTVSTQTDLPPTLTPLVESSPTLEPEPTEEQASTPTEAPTEIPTAEPLVFADARGNEIALQAPAQRIVSLAPSNTEILFAIGAGEQVVGRDSFSDYPPEASDVPDIGGGFGELDVETILSQNPDLVVATELTPAEQIQVLEDIGLAVFLFPNPNTLEAMFDNLLLAGRLTDHEEQSRALVEDLESRVASVQEKIASVEERPLVFYQIDSTDPTAIWTAGPGNFIHSLVTMAGGDNLGAVLDSPWAQISAEEIIDQNPQIIFVGDFTWGGVTPEDVMSRPGWEFIDAVENELVYPFNDNLVSRPGPRLVEGLEQMAELLHPEVFE